jgi:hypothetical protein
MAEQQRHAGYCDPFYDTARETAQRLTTAVATVHRLVNARVIPTRSTTGRRKIPKLWAGQLLASAYEIWPEELRPHYTAEELRRLRGIRLEQLALQLGLGRSAAYMAVHRREIPARRLPKSDRWIIPEDAVKQMEVYDLGNFSTALLPEKRVEVPPLNNEAVDPATDDEPEAEDVDRRCNNPPEETRRSGRDVQKEKR